VNAEASAQGRGVSLFSSGVSFLPKPLLEPRRPAIAIATGWATAFLPSILLAALVAYLLPAAEQPDFKVNGMTALLMLVILAPVVETLIMGGALIVLLRLFNPTLAVLISSAGWGVAHSLAAPAWGLVIWWPFLVFSTLFVTWRKRSTAAALAIAATVHGLHNLPSALILMGATG
jgi:hypothetical protein